MYRLLDMKLFFLHQGCWKQNVNGTASKDARVQLFLAGSLPTVYTSKRQCLEQQDQHPATFSEY